MDLRGRVTHRAKFPSPYWSLGEVPVMDFIFVLYAVLSRVSPIVLPSLCSGACRHPFTSLVTWRTAWTQWCDSFHWDVPISTINLITFKTMRCNRHMLSIKLFQNHFLKRIRSATCWLPLVYIYLIPSSI